MAQKETRLIDHETATKIWQRLDNPHIYVEPFETSMIMLMNKEKPCHLREVVCDRHGMISNFWRAMHNDYVIVMRRLRQNNFATSISIAEHKAEIIGNPMYYDVNMAASWFNNIVRYPITDVVAYQNHLHLWKDRIARVVQIDRDWDSFISNTVLMQTKSRKVDNIAMVFDAGHREQSEDAIRGSIEWATGHGDLFKIAYVTDKVWANFPDGWLHEGNVFYSPACFVKKMTNPLF